MSRFMLRPFFKKFIGLFISMVFVSMLSIGLLCAFASVIRNLESNFKTYIKDYEDVNAVADTGFLQKDDYADILQVEGVDQVEYRLSLNAFLSKADGRTVTTRICSFRDDGSSLFKRYILSSAEKSAEKVNISVVRRFAENNKFKVGDTVKIGFFNTYVDAYINEIIEVPEAMQARIYAYVWSDNTDFGFLYVGEKELNKALNLLATELSNKVMENEEFRDFYKQLIESTGMDIPDLVKMFTDEGKITETVFNQILVKGKDGYAEEHIAFNVKDYLEKKGSPAKTVTENHNMFYYLYITNALRQLRIAAVFLPVFFYAVTMIIIGLFVNQIIKTMTPQIGVMMSIGAGKWDIIAVFMTFTLIMSVCAAALGTVIGYVLNRLVSGIMVNVYSLPTASRTIDPLVAVLSSVSMIVFAQVATVISCRAIFRITPKDATISNEAKRKKLPKGLQKFIDKAPMAIKLGVNSIAQNPRRFFVSVFSVFASLVIILLTMFFSVSKTALIDQTVGTRLKFDAQVYMTSVLEEEKEEEFKNEPSIKEMLSCYYTYAKVSDIGKKKDTFVECLAYNENDVNNMFTIPDKNGKKNLKIQGEGVILPVSVARELNVKEGDVIWMSDIPIRIVAISKQYAHPAAYMSKKQMEKFKTPYVSSVLLKVNSEEGVLEFMSKQNTSLTVFTRLLKKDMISTFGSIDIFVYILIGFAFGMGFIILTIMSQNTLMEQKRQLSIFRAIGFTVGNVSNIWMLQSIAQFILSVAFAIPAAIGSAAILFRMASSAANFYPVIVTAPTALISIAFIAAIIVISHLIAMFSIKKWNLADNTRTRE